MTRIKKKHTHKLNLWAAQKNVKQAMHTIASVILLTKGDG